MIVMPIYRVDFYVGADVVADSKEMAAGLAKIKLRTRYGEKIIEAIDDQSDVPLIYEQT